MKNIDRNEHLLQKLSQSISADKYYWLLQVFMLQVLKLGLTGKHII